MKSCWFCGRESHEDRPNPMDHGFTEQERREYATLPWRGRDAYDHARWYMSGVGHHRAFVIASAAYPPK